MNDGRVVVITLQLVGTRSLCTTWENIHTDQHLEAGHNTITPTAQRGTLEQVLIGSPIQRVVVDITVLQVGLKRSDLVEENLRITKFTTKATQSEKIRMSTALGSPTRW